MTLSVAVPFAVSVPSPQKVRSDRTNPTVPLGVPDPGAAAVTVAVSVTVWPYTAGDGVAVTVAFDPSLLMVSVETAETLGLKLVAPP